MVYKLCFNMLFLKNQCPNICFFNPCNLFASKMPQSKKVSRCIAFIFCTFKNPASWSLFICSSPLFLNLCLIYNSALSFPSLFKKSLTSSIFQTHLQFDPLYLRFLFCIPAFIFLACFIEIIRINCIFQHAFQSLYIKTFPVSYFTSDLSWIQNVRRHFMPNFPISVLFQASLLDACLSRFQKRCGGRNLNKNTKPLTYPEEA